MMEEIGKVVLFFGAMLVIVGALLVLFSKFAGLGRLPGDLVIQSGNVSCFIPLASSIMLSLVLTILLNVIVRLLNR